MVDRYHHGNLREELLERVGRVIADRGVAAVSLRSLATDTGVSHTAPRHHFGSRVGLLTAFAAQGYRLMAEALGAARGVGGSFLDVGVAYVKFAGEFPAHFAVMFDASVIDQDDPELVAAQSEAFGELRHGIDTISDPSVRADAASAAIAAWAMMHGLAVLDGSGALDLAHVRDLIPEDDLLVVARRAGHHLFGAEPSVADPPDDGDCLTGSDGPTGDPE